MKNKLIKLLLAVITKYDLLNKGIFGLLLIALIKIILCYVLGVCIII